LPQAEDEEALWAEFRRLRGLYLEGAGFSDAIAEEARLLFLRRPNPNSPP